MSDAAANGNHDPNPASSAREHVSAAAEELKGAAEDIKGAAARAARDLRDKAEEFAGEWKDKATGIQKELEGYVRKNPTKSVLAALGVGLVIGIVLRR